MGILLGGLSCHEAPTGWGEPAERDTYRVLLGNPFDEETAEDWAKLPFERLSLDRSGCYWSCPVFQVEFFRDGSALYDGGPFAPREGRFEGSVDLYAYSVLCALAERTDLLGMQERFAAGWTDDETITVEFDRAGHTKSIEDYGRRGPPELQAYVALFERLSESIDWSPVDGADSD